MQQRRLEMPAGREARLAPLTGIEVRTNTADSSAPIGFKGHAAVFGKRARIGASMWGWFEVVQAGAFAQSIGEDDIRMLKNHNTDLPLARNTAGSLRLTEDEIGLLVDADMDPVSYARDLAISLERGTVSQMSFGFEVKSEEWVTLADDDPDKGKVVEPELRILSRAKLWETSPVTFPAYIDTDASLRAPDLEALARGLDLDQERLHEAAVAVRGGNLEDFRRLIVAGTSPAAIPGTAPAITPSPTTPVGRSNYQLARMG